MSKAIIMWGCSVINASIFIDTFSSGPSWLMVSSAALAIISTTAGFAFYNEARS